MMRTDFLSLFFEKQRSAARQLATWIAQSIYRVMRPTPTYIPRNPMSREEMERVRRRPETSTGDEQP